MGHNRGIARTFSAGKFEEASFYLREDIEWYIYEDNRHIKGKAALSHFCKDVSGYFQSVTTDFSETGLIEDGRIIAIYGNARFIRNSEIISEVNSCDVYDFDEKGFIYTIRSFCNTKKNNVD